MKVAYLLGSLNRGGLETFMLGAFKNKNKADFDFVTRFLTHLAFLFLKQQ